MGMEVVKKNRGQGGDCTPSKRDALSGSHGRVWAMIRFVL